jgi:secreted protein with Ig-like and vWFA domain
MIQIGITDAKAGIANELNHFVALVQVVLHNLQLRFIMLGPDDVGTKNDYFHSG